MRYTKLFVSILIILFFTCFELLSIEFSQRTGNTIDSTEAKYFSLFRDYKGFVKAEIIADSDGSRKINIVYEHGEADKTIDLTPDQSKNLRLYIENYELYLHEDIVFDNSKIPDAIQLDQSKIRDFINLDYFFRDLPVIEIQLIDGESIDDVRLVAVFDDTVILAPEREKYNWRDVSIYIPVSFKYVFECMVDGSVYELYAEPGDRNELIDHYSGLPFYDHPNHHISVTPDIIANMSTIRKNEVKDIEYMPYKVVSYSKPWKKRELNGMFFIDCSCQKVAKQVTKEQKYDIDDIFFEERVYHIKELKDNKSNQTAVNLDFGYYLTNNIILYTGLKYLAATSIDDEETFEDKGWALTLGTGWDDIPFLAELQRNLYFGVKLEVNYNFNTFHHQLSSQGKTTWIPEIVEIEDENNHISYSVKPYVKYCFYDDFSVFAEYVYEYHPNSAYKTREYIADNHWPSYWEMVNGQKYSGTGFSFGILYLL